MANIKSAKKRINVSNKKEAVNRLVKTKVKNNIKNVLSLAKNGDKENAKKALVEATKQIDMAASKGVYHKKNSARKVSRITKIVNNMQ